MVFFQRSVHAKGYCSLNCADAALLICKIRNLDHAVFVFEIIET